ncbi:hypothetical protein FALBO_618 [Fusarium albosuccineum]|uniref:Uncharacterized protein n=1 Tax=Fusarium albosuccineum TaxID=1237068 RepID=A0A8H4LQD9_9HYPO|nr:hypothetical protein FALBO_618 [Fusarium albosuccineum]
MEKEDLEVHCERTREVARYAYDHRVPFSYIKSELHWRTLDRAVRNVLGTEVAALTCAQIMDGLPIADVAYDQRLPGLFGEHPIEDLHEELCPGTMDKAREFYENWDPYFLRFDPKVVHQYEEAVPGTKPFNLRLIELVAVSLHQVGAELFKLDFRLHDGDIESILNWMPDTPLYANTKPRPTLFAHPHYFDYDIYPEGLADVAGYWTEDRILGGVAVFDRRLADDESNPPNVYFHSCHDYVTNRVCQLLDEQQQALIDFFLSDPRSDHCPLPVLTDKRNRTRLDWWDAHTHHQVYRDVWERKPLTIDDIMSLERRPRGETDYPEIGDAIFRINGQLGIPLPRPPPRKSLSPSPSPREE